MRSTRRLRSLRCRRFLDLVNRQDWAICESVQNGIRSRVHSHGFFAPMEDWNLDIRRYVTERIGAFVTG